jgi:hypothetical protein
MRSQLSKLKANSLVIVVLGVVIFAASSAGSTASSLITGHQIKDHSITGKDIKLHSITSSNISKGVTSLGGPDYGSTGPKGDVGAKGDAGAKGDVGPATSGLIHYWHTSSSAGLSSADVSSAYKEIPGTSAGFTTTGATSHLEFTLNTSCSTNHGDQGLMQIVLDGVVIAPGEELECPGTPGGFTGPVSLIRNADVGPGKHTVQAQVEANTGTGFIIVGAADLGIAEFSK